MRSEPQALTTLHPVSVLIGVPLMQIVRALLIPAFAVLAGGRAADRTLPLLLLLLLVGAAIRVLAWQRFRWSFDGETVRVEQGILSRTRRVVAVDRIQQVELDRPLVQRLLGVATLRIETAGSDAGPEIELRVLRLDQAIALRAALQPAPAAGHTVLDAAHAPDAPGPTAPADDTQLILALPVWRVALASVTGAQLLLAPALMLGALQLAGERADELIVVVTDRLIAMLESGDVPGAATWAVGVLALIVAAVITTLAFAIVRDGGFTLVRSGEDLVLRRGLLGTSESSVPLRRVQVVRVSANPLRRALGVAQLRIHSAGGSAGASGGASSRGGERRAVIPLVDLADVERIVAGFFPGVDTLPALRQHPPAAQQRALWRRLRGLVGRAVPLAVGWWVLVTSVRDGVAVPVPARLSAALVGSAGAEGLDPAWAVPIVVGLLLVALQFVLARAEYLALGHGLDAGVLVARRGALTRITSVAPLERLQAVTSRQSWFQARRGLSSVWAHVAGPGGDVVVADADADGAARLREVLSAAAAGATSDLSLTHPAGS